LKSKNKHALIRKFNPTSNEKKNIITQYLYNIKSPINVFSLYNMKKKLNKRRKKNLKGQKIKLKISSSPARPNSVESACPARPKIGEYDYEPDPITCWVWLPSETRHL
jgi:hypothetical protein